jgi:hypothetical protein
LGIPKFPKFGLSQLWRPITFCVNLWLRWSLKQSCSPHRNLFNDMLHATYMQINKADSWLLMIGSQIGNLTFHPSFGHNFLFKYSNGTCECILNIYNTRTFQWYNELFNSMNFNPCNCSLKIWEFIVTPIPKVEARLGIVGSFPHTSYTPKNMKCDSWASLLAHTFASPCIGRESKFKVTIENIYNIH